MDRGIFFITLVGNAHEKQSAALFIKSLRAFGGEMRTSPVWLLEGDHAGCSCADLTDERVRTLPLASSRTSKYPFFDKVSACAQAEDLTRYEAETMVWVNPECLIVQPPQLLRLEAPFHAAFRPVHICNVGLPVNEPLDGYWEFIYEIASFEDTANGVESFVDQQLIRPYYNTHIFALDPSRHICRKWLEFFEKLVVDAAFQTKYCQDELHKIFLHQAVLSALLLKEIGPNGIRILPPTYSYPWHLQEQISPERRATRLNDLHVLVYEDGCPIIPTSSSMRITEPLRGWLLQNPL